MRVGELVRRLGVGQVPPGSKMTSDAPWTTEGGGPDCHRKGLGRDIQLRCPQAPGKEYSSIRWADRDPGELENLPSGQLGKETLAQHQQEILNLQKKLKVGV